MSECVFCPDNWDNLDILAEYYGVAVLNPLNPVTEGHVLVIGSTHSADAAVRPDIASDLMNIAARWVQERGIEANIITSIGANATQTVRHTHLHVVPRRLNDGLPLPWTPQQMRCATCTHPRADHYEGGACGKRIAPSMRPCTCRKFEEKQ